MSEATAEAEAEDALQDGNDMGYARRSKTTDGAM
jgi:hypothetical protein